jgi:hypothetical protein
VNKHDFPNPAFFTSMCAAFERAASALGAVRRFYRIGGRTLELLFAGPALVPYLTPALEHLALPLSGPRPDLVLHVWDSASTGVPVPACSWRFAETGQRNGIIQSQAPGLQAFLSHQGGLSLINYGTNSAIYWVRSGGELPDHECAAPFRPLLHVWLRQYGLHLVHSAAVGNTNGGVLLAAKGGAGKSTTSLLCLTAGLSFAGDDFCLVAPGGDPRAHALYSSAKLDVRTAANLPDLARCTSAFRDGEKKILFLSSCFSDQLVRDLPLRGLLVPVITGRLQTRITPVPPARALLATAPSSLFLLPGADGCDLAAMTSLVRSLPCFRLELGYELDKIPEAIAGFLERVRR